MSSDKECITADELAKALLQYALKSVANPELKRECTQHYLDEMQLLSFFSVDYVLGLKSVTAPQFAAVRDLYNEEIECLCSIKEPPFTFRTVMERFGKYCEACNSNTLAPKEYKGKPLVFWDLGTVISRLASDVDPWVPSALEVTVHVNIFLREIKRLSEFLEHYEVIEPI